MNKRENLKRIFKKQGYDFIPAQFRLCETLIEKYKQIENTDMPFDEYFDFPWKNLPGIKPVNDEQINHAKYMPGALAKADSFEQILDFPFPEYDIDEYSVIKEAAEQIICSNRAPVGNMQCTIWETAWSLRGMENIMIDMISGDPIIELLFDRITDAAEKRAAIYAKAGADYLFIGDDIGMQHSAMMSLNMYRLWLKPRLKRVIQSAKAVNPDIIIIYHSCGYIEPFIPDLIESGIEVLNPVQPECMSFEKIYSEYSGALSFHGTVGTQTVMPFGTPGEVAATVKRNLSIAGPKGGLLPAPTHILEPDVPWENVKAYIKACREYK